MAMKNKANNKPRTRELKPFEELTITDDFMFGAVMSDPKRCRKLLEYILGIKITKIDYKEKQKTIDVSYDSKGVRLDLTVIDEKGQVFDIEIQNGRNENLPLRIRYYHDMLDLDMLEKSMDYTKLNRCFVIFICTFDPFPGNDRKMYTFTNLCHEQDGLELGDETVKIFLNTKGTVGEVDEDIDKFLAYVDGRAAEGQFTQDIAAEVERIKQHNETKVEYMTLMMELKEQRREGFDEGINKGRVDTIVNNVRALVAKKGWSTDEAFDTLGVSPEDRVVVISRL